ncbi:hypothetical protein LCGC14_0619990 [marine sediment metagenome]|uniref:Uncharacterized protein n=1 Tax=marine sediment metagenome TaxID=412755 RepID=A0A0F9RPE0_9ZZZZ
MPKYVPQHMKSPNTINLQPKRDSTRIQRILAYDISGYKKGRIAQLEGMTNTQVSIIVNSPLYKVQRDKQWAELRAKVVDNESDKIAAGDPIEQEIKDLARTAIDVKKDLLVNGNAFVKNAASSDILDRAGYAKQPAKTKTIVEIDRKISDRWDRVLSNGPNEIEGISTLRITQEMSE